MRVADRGKSKLGRGCDVRNDDRLDSEVAGRIKDTAARWSCSSASQVWGRLERSRSQVRHSLHFTCYGGRSLL